MALIVSGAGAAGGGGNDDLAMVEAGAAGGGAAGGGGGGGEVLAAPVVALRAGSAAALAAAFAPGGGAVAVAGADEVVRVFAARGQCEQVASLEGHKNAVTDLTWLPDGSAWAALNAETGLHAAAVPARLVTASADSTAACWDVEAGKRVRQFKGHKGIVNAVAADVTGFGSRNLFASGGDDGRVRLWDVRYTRPVHVIEMEDDMPVTALAMAGSAGAPLTGLPGVSEAATSGTGAASNGGVPTAVAATLPVLCVGGTDAAVRVWDMRQLPRTERDPQHQREPLHVLKGHAGIVTGLALRASSGGDTLLSHAMDGTVRIWDLRPFVGEAAADAAAASVDGLVAGDEAEAAIRSVSCLHAVPGAVPGAPYNADFNLLRCAWSPDGRHIAAGTPGDVAAGQTPVTNVWDADSERLKVALPGHSGAVSAVAFNPAHSNILASAGVDGKAFLGTLPL